MKIDCEWIEKNLEALFCDSLGVEESRGARAHIESCVACGKEVAALNAIDPLVKKYFQRQMSLAGAARQTKMSVRGSIVYGTAAAAIAAVLLAAVILRTPQVNTVNPSPAPSSAPENSRTAGSVETPRPIKADETAPRGRAKPEAAPAAPDSVRTAPVIVPDKSAPDFLVIDPAGYSSTLEDLRGYTVVIGVWTTDQAESAANLERLYRTFAANTKLRFLGVSYERQPRAANTTFPLFYNQGSKLLGVQPGDFVLVDEKGSIELRGSLVKDFDNLVKSLQTSRQK